MHWLIKCCIKKNKNCDQMMCSCDQLKKLVTSVTSGKNESRALRELSDYIKNLNFFPEDERRSYGFETTWGWVINDIIFIFGWTIPLNTFLQYQSFFIDLWTWQIWCHQPISCHGFSAATEDELNWRSGLDIRSTTIRKAKFWAGRSLLIHVHPCSFYS